MKKRFEYSSETLRQIFTKNPVKLQWPLGGLRKDPIASPDEKVANEVKSSVGTAILAHGEPLKPLWQRRHRCGPQHSKHCRRVGIAYPVSSKIGKWLE